MGDAECLVQVQMTYISPNFSGGTEANLCVHVRSIHIDLTTMPVYDLAHFLDLRLKHAVRTGVCDHHGANPARVLLTLCLQVGQIEISSLGVALDGNNTHPSHCRGSGVCAMGGDRDETDIPFKVAVCVMKFADGQQSSEFSLCPRVGLKGNAVHARDMDELPLESLDEVCVALDFIMECVGVHVREPLHRDERHFGATVELHGARTKGNHRMNQGQVLRLQMVDVP
jgi:hypothetical protein